MVNMIDETLIGSAINRNYKDTPHILFDILGLTKMELHESINLADAATQGYLGVYSPSLALAFIGSGSIIFGLQSFADDQFVDKLAREFEVLSFYINPAEEINTFRILRGGKCIRDNFSNDQFQEIGEPLEIEKIEKDPTKLIVNLLSRHLRVDFFKEFIKCDILIFKRRKSFLGKFF